MGEVVAFRPKVAPIVEITRGGKGFTVALRGVPGVDVRHSFDAYFSALSCALRLAKQHGECCIDIDIDPAPGGGAAA